MKSLKGSSLGTDSDVLSDFIDKSNLNYLEIGCFDGVTLTTIALKYKNISYTDISVTHYGAFEVNFNQ
jgi:hypothetical protein